ncbi:MAG: peroxidase [Candidatus Dormibacteraeota bacterium]|uniref:Peroxidase n=1 Tax=Candidatus Amunia macphersoniae TaxID=3127014 RepID=A0A934KM30_9BACT|nr:peroxidase [Candidatus Dormibacteraeota bacterium]
MKPTTLQRAVIAVSSALDRRYGWDKLPKWLGLLVLAGIRDRLRAENLYDTGRDPSPPAPLASPNDPTRFERRTIDGMYDDKSDPRMGSLGSRFGRNIPLERGYPEAPEQLLSPNVRTVSRRLLTRDTFQPASTLNLLAGAWIQFEVHDWFSHGKNVAEDPWTIPLADDDPWPQHPMQIQRTRPDPTSDAGRPPSFVTADTHWWDASQIYGDDPAFAAAIRSGEKGKLRLDEHGFLPAAMDEHLDLTGVAGNFWVGLALLHSLFMREHNSICDRLVAESPSMSDDQVYEKARLINAALIAKIHTVDWTPAIIAHPTTVDALRSNWWGILGERFDARWGRLTKWDLLRGIPGTATNHHGVPYSLTEEFVAVYRMHPLIPDDFTFRSLQDDAVLQQLTLEDVGALKVRGLLGEYAMSDLFYSFGRMNPGAITLHNYPRMLQHFNRPDGTLVDLAATDILRSRERGVPRYNEFRRLFHLKPARTFEQLTDNPQWAKELREVYEGDIEKVDLTIGMYAEPLPKGFGFSDTAFRVFILMASRRLKSDRFFTVDYRPEVYTQSGIDWVERNSMRTVLLRHFPELAPALTDVANPFAPWVQTSGTMPVASVVGHAASSVAR